MSRIILDFGSANTHKNDWPYLKRMLDELKAVDTGKHEIIIKHQLFKEAGENVPLNRGLFINAFAYATELGYKTTSSVFDKESLDFLLQFDVPFIKIANRRELDWLIEEIPRKVPVYVSQGEMWIGDTDFADDYNVVKLACVSKYPSTLSDYENTFKAGFNSFLVGAVSDHTTNFDLWNGYHPRIIEWHYKLEDSTGLDAGPFARTPEQLKEVL